MFICSETSKYCQRCITDLWQESLPNTVNFNQCEEKHQSWCATSLPENVQFSEKYQKQILPIPTSGE